MLLNIPGQANRKSLLVKAKQSRTAFVRWEVEEFWRLRMPKQFYPLANEHGCIHQFLVSLDLLLCFLLCHLILCQDLNAKKLNNRQSVC